MTLGKEIRAGWLEYLHSVDYSHEQTTKCELWCQFGDWSKQSVDRTLDTQFVFFPTPVQVTEAITNARQSGLVVMTAEQAQEAFNRVRVETSTLEQLKRNSADGSGQNGVSPTPDQVAKMREEFEAKYGRTDEE